MNTSNGANQHTWTKNDIIENEYLCSFLCEGELDGIAKDVLFKNKFDRANEYYNPHLKKPGKVKPGQRAKPKQKPESQGEAPNSSPDTTDSNTTEGIFPSPSLPGCDARDGTASTRPLSDLGNAYRLWDKHGTDVRFVPETKEWLVWNGSSWKWDTDLAVLRRFAADLSYLIYEEGRQDTVDQRHFIKWARKSQQTYVISSSIPLLSNFEQVRLPLSSIDADPYLIGIDGAQHIIDLRTGTTRAAKRSDYVTKSMNISEIGVPWKAERFMVFLEEIFNEDVELINWVQRWCGYLLTGLTVEQIFVFFFGLGANGKSVFAELLRHCMGDYARAIASETLTESRRQAGAASPDLAALKGVRLGISTEIEEGSAMAESLVKSLVSGDSMSVRPVYCSPIQFSPRLKLLVLGNHKPHIRGTDHGIWRRVRLVPFNHTFAPDERDPYLLEKLKAEAPHIVAWIIQGCLKWQERGLSDIPSAIQNSTAEYQSEQDLIGQWLSECCQTDKSAESDRKGLYANYKAWAADNGFRQMSSNSFSRRLGEHGFTSRKSNGKTIWQGLALLDVRDYGQIHSY